MIYRLTDQRTADFHTACGYERVFGSKMRTALAAYGQDTAGIGFWVGYAGATVSAAFYLSGKVLIASSDNRILPDEVAQLVRDNGVTEIDTSWEQCEALQKILGGTTESSFYMAYDKEKIIDDFTGIVPCTDLHEVFSVLQQSHEYYRAHLQYEPWSKDLSRKLDKGLMELIQLNIDGVTVGTGSIASEDDRVGAIAAVAVIPEYRGRGLGSKISGYLVNRILEKGKQPVLISGYDAVSELYRRIGFHETGRWGELYINPTPTYI